MHNIQKIQESYKSVSLYAEVTRDVSLRPEVTSDVSLYAALLEGVAVLQTIFRAVLFEVGELFGVDGSTTLPEMQRNKGTISGGF